MGKNILTKDSILATVDLPVKEIDVPEWGGVVYIRGLNAEERDSFEEVLFVGDGKDRKLNLKNIRARLLSMTLCDEKGNLLFKPEDVIALGKKSAKILNGLFTEAQTLSALGEQDIKDAVKNSEGGIPG